MRVLSSFVEKIYNKLFLSDVTKSGNVKNVCDFRKFNLRMTREGTAILIYAKLFSMVLNFMHTGCFKTFLKCEK